MRSPENERGGNLAVRATLGDERGDTSLGRRQPLAACAPADPAELGAGLLDPGRRPELARTLRAPRRSRLARRASAAAACGRRRARAAHAPARTRRRRLVVCDRMLQEGGSLVDRPSSGSHETTATRHMRKHPIAPEPRCIRLPARRGFASRRPTDRARAAPRRGRQSTSACSARATRASRSPLGLVEPVAACVRVAALECDKPERSEMDRCVKPDLLLSELQRQLRVRAGDLELAAMGGDHGGGQVIPRRLEAVLEADIECTGRRSRPRAASGRSTTRPMRDR